MTLVKPLPTFRLNDQDDRHFFHYLAESAIEHDLSGLAHTNRVTADKTLLASTKLPTQTKTNGRPSPTTLIR
jgi:hypothetical protein